MKKRIKAKKATVVFLSAIMVLTSTVFTFANTEYPVGSIGDSSLVIVDGELYTIERTESGTSTKVVAKDCNNQTVASATELPNGDIELTENGVTTIIENAIIDGNAPLSASSGWSDPEYYKWNVGEVTSAISLTLAISCAMTGIGIPQAAGIASSIINMGASHVWAKTGVSWKFDSTYQYCRRVTDFYSNSACTKHLLGPFTTTQKKAKDAA